MSPEKILSILKGLNPSKTAGIDNLSSKFLKGGTLNLARPTSQLCNLSIKLNFFPRSCKIAKVKPLFKTCSKTDPQNYRPISLFLLLLKIIERIVHDQTEEFLSKKKILGCILDESLSGKSMALNVIDKINSRFKFLHRQKHFLNTPFT